MAGTHDDILWGNIVSSGKNQFKIGISRTWEDKGTYEYLHIKVWFWSKLSFYDSNNHLDLALYGIYNDYTVYENHILISAKSTSINVSTGGTQCIGEYTINLYKKQTANVVNWNAALSGLEAIGVGTGIYANRDCVIEALAYHTVKYDANGGSNAPSSQTKWYGTVLTLSSTIPTRAGCTFLGWATSATGDVRYSPNGKYEADADITLYAVWKFDTPQDVYIEDGVIYARAFIVDTSLNTVEINNQGDIYASAFTKSDSLGICKGVLYAKDFINGLPV